MSDLEKSNGNDLPSKDGNGDSQPKTEVHATVSPSDDGYGYEGETNGFVQTVITGDDETQGDFGNFDSEFEDEKETSEEGGNTERLLVPDDNSSEFYESYFPELEDPLDHSKEAAHRFAEQQGLRSTIRENAHLTQSVKNFRKQAYISLLVNVCLIILIITLIFAFSQYPKTNYIPTKDNRAICEVSPQDNPNITDATILEFAKEGVLNLYSFDYINYQARTNDALARWFTSQGRIDSVKALDESGILETVNEHALVLKAGTTSAATIESKGTSNSGKPFWVVKFPMIIDIYSGKTTPQNQQKHMVTVRVVADNASAVNTTGLGITSVTLSPMSN